MNTPTEFTMQTINLLKIAAFIRGLGLTDEQIDVMINKLSIDQCTELGESLNVFEQLDFGIVDEPGEPDDGELYVSYFTKEEPNENEYMRELVRYPEQDENQQNIGEPQWVGISEIVVPDEYSKEQLLLAFEYIHDLRNIDTDIMAVNTIAHLYHCPDKITVKTVS